jgi:hypothetical protein
VRAHAGAGDIVIDLDDIAREHGYDRDRPTWAVGLLLEDRNARLEALAREPADRVAWVILTAPSRRLRQWWREQLNVRADDLVVLVPDTRELYRRITSDPDRRRVRTLHLRLAAKWFILERRNDPGILKGDCDEDGNPTDPLHPWNR